jgi:hypothetical protein
VPFQVPEIRQGKARRDFRMRSERLTAQLLERSAEKAGSECSAATDSSFRPLKVFPSKGPLEQQIKLTLVHRYSPAP